MARGSAKTLSEVFTLTVMTFDSLEIEAAGLISFGQSVMVFHNSARGCNYSKKGSKTSEVPPGKKDH